MPPIFPSDSVLTKNLSELEKLADVRSKAVNEINVANSNIDNLNVKNNFAPVDTWDNADQLSYEQQTDLKKQSENRLNSVIQQQNSLTGRTSSFENDIKDVEITSLNSAGVNQKTGSEANLQEWDESDTGRNSNVDLLSEAEVNGKKNLFDGVKISPENEEKLFNWRMDLQQQKSGENLIKNFHTTWDWRFGYGYSNTQSIGNNMPYGPEWVGSPSIINPFALIRFDHIASTKHHNYIIDQVGTPGFASIGMTKEYAKITNVEENTSLSVDGQLKVRESSIPDDISKIYGTDNVYSDSDGSLYRERIDVNTEIWETTIPTSKNPDMNNITTLQVNVNGITDVTTPRPGEKTGLSPDLIEKYWLKKLGWTEENGKMTPIPQSEYGKHKNPPESDEDIEFYNKYQDLITKGKQYVLNETSRGWKFKDYYKSKLYIQKPNTKPQQFTIKEPYVDELCNPDNWLGQEQFMYEYSDFLYHSYYGKIPNNHLITLRRFPVPVNDKASVPAQDESKEYLVPVARAITYLGESTGNKISDILSFGLKMNWKTINADVQNVQGNEKGAEDGPFSGVAKVLGVITKESNFGSISGWDEQRAKFDPYENGMYANRVYGPVNAITSTFARERGLELEHTINLKFQYSLKSIGGINPKAAMLDIMANILSLTYNNADFWGGAIRYFPNKPAYPFLGSKKGMDSWYNGDVTGFIDSLGDQFSDALGGLGSILSDLFSNPMQTLKNLATKGGQIGMAIHQKKKGERPNILGFKALLTGDPVGEWHLVIGNPFNPIATIGNLIVTNTKITFSDQLGIDDFPEDMFVDVTLQHGRPRDKGDIESIFNRGGGRLYYSSFGQETDAWNNVSSTSNSKIDTSWKPGASSFRPSGPVDVNGGGRFTGYLSDNVGKGSGDMVNQSVKSASKVYDTASSRAFQLAQKVGFKSN